MQCIANERNTNKWENKHGLMGFNLILWQLGWNLGSAWGVGKS